MDTGNSYIYDTDNDGISNRVESLVHLEKHSAQKKLAYAAISGMLFILIVVLFLFESTRIVALTPLLETFVWGFVSIIGLYMGATTWAATAAFKREGK